MSKRIYSESIKKWAVGAGVTSGSIIFLMFIYLSSIGAITVNSYSGDMICDGTINNPCYAIINFTANEDIFIYPTDYDPWGRNTPFDFEPDVDHQGLQDGLLPANNSRSSCFGVF